MADERAAEPPMLPNIPAPRQWSNAELRAVLAHFPGIQSVVNVSGWKDLDKERGHYRDYFPASCTYRVSNYEKDQNRGGGGTDVIAIDLMAPLPEELVSSVDVAFSHTVLEHVPDPLFAFQQMAKLTSDLIIAVVPFKQKLHFEAGQYGDYYRFTPFSMRAMYERNGMTVLYESFTPRPSLDVYLFYVGTKQPERYAAFPRRVVPIETLDQIVGQFSAMDLLLNAASRFRQKYIKA